MSTRELSWPVPVALVALSAIPLTVGTLRLIQLAGGPAVIPADHRFASFPLPLVVHIVGATTYALAGILQFVPRFRRRHLAWHRRAGRLLAVAGLLVAISALWMTLFYQAQPGTGDLLYVLRLVFGSAMAACLVLGLAAVRSRDIAAHRAWMIRAYAIGLTAGTQAFTEGIGGAVFGTGELRGDLAKGAGWVINLAVAEWAIRRPAVRRGDDGTTVINGPVTNAYRATFTDPPGSRPRSSSSSTARSSATCAPAYTGHGYATEAVRELLRYCFEELGLHRSPRTASSKTTSWRIMERVGH